jgi:polyhydroxyalkanoate synthesis regulator protein
MMDQSIQLKLHDIKPIVEVKDYSFFYFSALTFTVVVLLFGFIYLAIKWYRNRKKYNKRKEAYKTLLDIDLGDTKKAAYALTSIGATFKDDTPRNQEMYQNMINRLENYKYKKEVKELDDETKSYIELYKEMIDA